MSAEMDPIAELMEIDELITAAAGDPVEGARLRLRKKQLMVLAGFADHEVVMQLGSWVHCACGANGPRGTLKCLGNV